MDPFIVALKAGDEGAFRKLVNDYQQKVLNTAVNMLQDVGMAEDLVQEVFVTVFRKIDTFNEQSALSTWIYRITVNKCNDHLRAKTRLNNKGIFSRLFQHDNTEVIQNSPDFVHPGVVLENRENAKYLYQAIKLLPENQKTAFILCHIEELPQKEVAVIMEISVKAIESLLQRAKANLLKYLTDL